MTKGQYPRMKINGKKINPATRNKGEKMEKQKW
jgi:hypothetical protein